MQTNEKELDIEAVNEIIADFFISYSQKDEKMSDKEWLTMMLYKYMPTTPYSDIVEYCDEFVNENVQISNLMEEAIKSSKEQGWNAETWLYSKIKKSSSDDDFDLEILAKTDKMLSELAAIIIENIDENHSLIAWHEDDSKKDTENVSSNKKEQVEKKEGSAPSSGKSPIITKSALSAGLQKTLMGQYQKTLKIDLGNINLRSYDTTEAALRISKSAALSGVGSIALTTGFTLMTRALQGNLRMSQLQLFNILLKAGANNGLKAAVGGALKVSAERGLLPMLSRATPARTLAAITCIGMENMKILYDYADGKLSGMEAMEQAGKVSTACVFSLSFGFKGAMIGAAAFSVVPVAGPIVGALLGEMVGGVVGNQVGTVFYSNVKNLCLTAKYAVLADYDVIIQLEEMFAEPLTNKLKHKRKNLLYV